MRSKNCVQCNEYIKTTTNMGKHWVYKRLGGYIHEQCIDKYNKHKQATAQIRFNHHIETLKLVKKNNPSTRYNDYYIKNYARLRAKNRDNYLRNKERRKEYQRRYNIAVGKRKNTLDETDDVYRVKVL